MLFQLYLWNNSFTGPIPPSINAKMPKLVYLSFAQNNLSGHLPADLCKLKELVVLDLSENHLIGEIPDCWERAEGILFLNLAGNKLFGRFPMSIGSLNSLQLLDLSNNDLSGELPEISMNLTQLWTLDLSRNAFTGRIPTWLGKSLSEMRILNLHLNQFMGTIPLQMSNFTNLHVLDLSNNHLSGTIPRSFGNLIGMKKTAGERGGGGEFFDSTAKDVVMTVWLATKGRYYAYDKLLSLLTLMDLSMNNLSGRIPNKLMNLSGMNTLNLSGNHLVGEITERIGHLWLLETLDLSRNKLSGPIPTNLSSLSFLHHLNLSNNNFSGRIPTGGQLNTLVDPSIYAGNPNLCGDPSLRRCPGDEPSHQNRSRTVDGQDGDQEDDTLDEILFYAFIILGFLTGFWVVSGILILNRTWRITYFRFFDTVYDKVYVITAVNINKIKRTLSHKGLIKN
ncbi:putative leucine-rich repeat domain superfamily [Dioscorea sansibarensis]